MNTLFQENVFWSISQEKVLELVQVDLKTGLSAEQIKARRAQFGANTIREYAQTSLALSILEGIRQPMILLLLSVALLSLFFGKLFEATAMIIVVIAYIAVELFNKYRADRMIIQLKKISVPMALVLRNGQAVKIPTEEIVVGDILLLSAGARVPADARLITAYSMLVNEALLTGEAMPVEKNANRVLDKSTPVADRINCVFAGTTVLSGEGTAVVYAVGETSALGHIAEYTQKTTKEVTVLQEAMTKLAKVLAVFAVLASALMPLVGYVRGFGFQEMVLTWLSLTFLLIPGQPPIIITMALALAAFALAKKHVIAKKLQGVEIAGYITAVISDKTGTITESKMVVQKFYLADGSSVVVAPQDIQEKIVLALPRVLTDPTDRAVAQTLTVSSNVSSNSMQQVGFTGFSPQKPWRDIVYAQKSSLIHVITGSPELLITHARLSNAQKNMLREHVQQEASQGKRLTAYAYCQTHDRQLHELKNLEFVAIAVMSDPVRPGVKQAVELLEQAKIKTFIVTGDHKETAAAIAVQIGISGDIVTGEQLENMHKEELVKSFAHSGVYARVDPLQKLRLVNILQAQGEIVAVIGDGVNDAPALKAAQLGIAMGEIGTDVAKEASDLIITDDNYTHVLDIVYFGRTALDNFRKGIGYYLSAKCILLVIFIVPLFLGIAFPFVPIQIILIELLMDLATSTIFVTESVEYDSMTRPTQGIQNFLRLTLIKKILQNSMGLASGILIIYFQVYSLYNLVTAQTAALVTWLIGHILLALNLKQEKMSLLTQGFFSNRFGTFWLVSMLIFSLIITNVPALYPYIKTTALPISLWIEIIIIVCLSTFWIEIKKRATFKSKLGFA